MITHLEDNQIFVFGSNLSGNHAGGAARYAAEQFDAADGIGEGLIGKCYALPTLDMNMQRFTPAHFLSIVQAFFRCAMAHPELEFLLTKVGCGIAGYPESYVKTFFEECPKNIVKPKEWRHVE